MQPKKLEEYKYFQITAWIICIIFAIFVLTLTLRLKDVVSNISDIQNSNFEIEKRLMDIENTLNSELEDNSSEVEQH